MLGNVRAAEAPQGSAHDRTGRRRRRTTLLAAAGLLALLLVLSALGSSFGRADPTGSYRPELVGDTIKDGCYPLPGGAQLPFPYVVRTDGDVETADGPRRHLVLHWSNVDRAEVLDGLEAAFAEVGLTDATREGDDVLTLAGTVDGEPVEVRAELTDLDNPAPEPIVRGRVELDLPVAERAADAPATCDDKFTTKRFPAGPERHEGDAL